MAIIVGIVVGAGIFETPSLVAANAGNKSLLILVWVAGGVLSLLGALCYAELASTYPDAGGSYYYLRKSFGDTPAFLYAWSRLAVIQTGSIALLGFVFGDYATQVLPMGPHSPAWYAAAAIAAFTVLNIIGVRLGKSTQNLLTAATVIGLLGVVVAGFTSPGVASSPATAQPSSHSALGLMMVFVLLTYGGWQEAGYISAELKNVQRSMAVALISSIALITAIYLLVNLALVNGLGLAEMAGTKAVAAEVMRRALGPAGALVIALAVMFAALSSLQGTVFTGARTTFALGRDFPMLRSLGHWEGQRGTPTRALWVQGLVALALVLLGGFTREGFKTMVEYTAPVFWFFVCLTGISLMILRRREPHVHRPFRVPGYPATPIFFIATSAYLLYASLAYTGVGAIIGVVVMLSGAVVLYLAQARRPASMVEKQRKVA